MEYAIYLIMLFIAGVIVSKLLKPKISDIEIKTAMAKAQLEWMKTPEYKAHQEAMWELEKQKLPKIYKAEPFGKSYWTKTKDKKR